MRKEITVSAELRESRGKNEARRLRVKGFAPAILSGASQPAVAIAVSPKEVNKILHSNTGHNTIFNLAIQGGEDTPVMIVDWQLDPVKDNLLHVDMKRIDLTKRIVVKVRVHVTGEPKGVKLQGGLLELITREIEIECLPDEIPEMFTLDVTELMIGQNLRAGDIPVTGSTKLVSPADQDSTEAPAPSEPEVIKKGKKEEELAAEPEKGKKK